MLIHELKIMEFGDAASVKLAILNMIFYLLFCLLLLSLFSFGFESFNVFCKPELGC